MKRLITLGLGFALGSAVFASPNAEVASNAQNKMGWKLFDKTLQVAAEKNEKNVLISPTSANIALTMAMQGAKGDTLAEMKSVLAYGDASLVEVHQALNELMVSLEKKPTVEMDEGTSQRLSIANKIWSNKKEFSINPEFTVLMNQYYQRNASEEIIKEVEEFVPTAVVAEVNSWVAKKTENMIQKLLSESAIDEDTRMILVNALYFQAQWLNKFSAVADFDFTNIDGKTNAVPAIRGSHYTGYAEGNGFAVVEMAFRQGSKKSGEGFFEGDRPVGTSNFVLDVIVPNNGVAIQSVMQDLDAVAFDKVVATKESKKVALTLPKFKVAFEASLKKTLINMGMVSVFDDRMADLSGLGTNHQENPIVVSDVFQKTAMELDEKGLKAAAATAVIVSQTTSILPNNEIVVNVDKPFGVVLRDSKTNTVLFIGTIGDVK